MRCFIILLVILPGIFCLSSLPANIPIKKARELHILEQRLIDGLTDFMITEHESNDLKEAIKLIHATKVLRKMGVKSEPTICVLCNVVAQLFINYHQSGVSAEKLIKVIKSFCMESKLESEEVCNGAIDLNAPIFLFIVNNKLNSTAESFCSIIAQAALCTVPQEDNSWEVKIPPLLNNPPQPIINASEDDRPLRILQISDLHYDELYAPGSNAVCGQPLCCGSNQGKPEKPEAAAGNWGDYRSCDMPWYSVLDLLDQVRTHEIDFVYYTGDIVNHRVWATSIANNIKNLKQVYGQFKKTFGSIPFFPILGNHEPNPVNEFALTNVTTPELSTQWLYDLVADEWKYWLPEETQKTIRQGGYYTVLVKPGFRIIALNSNVAYTFNWWLVYDHSVLQTQLQWLTDTLAQAEKNGEIVHILSHVPSGDNTCLIKWGKEYKRIIQRFAHIVVAQFVGHTHYDEMNLFFNNSNINEPINVVYNGGSFTTFVNVNPNYAIYEINPNTMEVEDYDQWIYNVTEANQNSLDVRPRWYKLYSFKEAYGVKSMQLSELSKLVQNMAKNQTLLDQYYRFKMRDGDLALLQGCDKNCHESNLCNLVTTQFTDNKICNELIAKYRETLQ